MTWQQASTVVTDPREDKMETAISFMKQHCYFHNSLCIARISPIHCGRGLNRDMNIRKQELLGAIREAGYYSLHSGPQ